MFIFLIIFSMDLVVWFK